MFLKNGNKDYDHSHLFKKHCLMSSESELLLERKNSEDEYENQLTRKMKNQMNMEQDCSKQKDIHNDEKAKQLAKDICCYSHFPTQSSLQNNYIESSCMCKQE